MQPYNTEQLRSDTELSCMCRQAGVGTGKQSTKAFKSERARAANTQSSRQEKLETRRQIQKHINIIAQGGKKNKDTASEVGHDTREEIKNKANACKY